MLRHLRMVPPLAPTAAEPRSGRLEAPAPIEAPSATHSGVAVIGPARILRSPLSGKNSSDLGLLTHTLVSTHAPLIAGGLPQDLVPQMYELAHGLLDANSNRRRVLAVQAAGLAYRYLNRLALSAPFQLLGVEYETGNGPVDVAWVHGENGRVVFDELKTSRVATQKMPKHWTAQVRRYAAAGQVQHGDAFVGVRLLPLDRWHLARFFPATGPSVALSSAPTELLRGLGGDS